MKMQFVLLLKVNYKLNLQQLVFRHCQFNSKLHILMK